MSTLAETVAQLERAFDESFSKPIVEARDLGEDLLIASTPHGSIAIRRNEIAAIARSPRLTTLPSRHPALCGLAGVRGTVVAVYSIAALLGDSPRAVEGGWIVLCAADRSIALWFDELVSHRRVRLDEIHDAADAPGDAAVVKIDGVTHTLVRIANLLDSIRRQASLLTED